MGLCFRDIAKHLQIGVGGACCLYRRFNLTGVLSPPKHCRRPEVRKLDEFHEVYIIGLLIENRGLYLIKICQNIKDTTWISVSGPTDCIVLQRNGYTWKKIVHVAKQWSVRYRGVFMAQTMHYPVDFFVWVDEIGGDQWDHIRKFGYQIRGLAPTYHRHLSSDTRMSAIAALSSDHILA